jgi:AbrB family looped-hinge helix DNA binding protein
MGKDRLYKKGLTIDDRNRIVIPAELLEELKLNTGDKVSVYADFEENKIIIKKEGKK